MVREDKALLLYPEILRAAERASQLIHKENVCANICLGKCTAKGVGPDEQVDIGSITEMCICPPPPIQWESTQQLVLRSLDPLRLLSNLASI